ncbi:uncharacterized protein [Rutidosis leptorrhynchoides]|uniref:uncharacterized protein isoform X2 n=1 Tax=Rutidosis leptorrhynchoides TaxID=125765 RepID=UPI003A98F238
MAAATTGNQTKISIKVMVHKKDNRVLFAEADSSFIDILFSFMTLPLGLLVKIFEKYQDDKFEAIRGLKNLYKSVVDLPDRYMVTEESKSMIINPISLLSDLHQKLEITLDEIKPTSYFICQNWDYTTHYPYFTTCNLTRCTYSSCGKLMNQEIELDPTSKKSVECLDGSVFVSDVATFLVSDDLRVTPNTSGSTFQFLSDLGATDASQLEERTFDIGQEQVLALLQGALLFKYPLTYMVFSNKHPIRDLANPKQETSGQHLTKDIAAISKTMTIKVNLQKSSSKFLFAEVEDDFADFVFGFLMIPLGTAIGKLMNCNSSRQGLDNLYESISKMNEGYIKSQQLKNMLIQPQLAWNYISKNQIFPVCSYSRSSEMEVLTGSSIYCHSYSLQNNRGLNLTYDKTPRGRGCINETFRELILEDPRVQKGFLKGPAKFMLTDDFVLTPLSSFSTIALLNKMKVPLNDVVEHELSIGIEEGSKILQESLKPSGSLSDALLKERIQAH